MENRIAGTARLRSAGLERRRLLLILILIQLAVSLFFLAEYLTYYLVGYDNIRWEVVELFEISEALLILASIAIGFAMIALLTRRNKHVESQLRIASGAFHDLLEERFEEWLLSPAEAEVALFTIKGMSNLEIARIRNTSEGTVKAQSNAVFKKAGVKNRAQLLGLFVDDLVGGSILPKAERV
jgi:DNA-binding CsgD family transcriptional regulator